MSRHRPVDYAGAAGRIDLAKVPKLGPRYVLQPKIDGALVRVHLDGAGRIARLFTRSGAETPHSLTAGLIGAHVGEPHSELAGELEAYTEASTRLALTQGYRRVHLFDCIRAGPRYLAREPYAARRDALLRMISHVVNFGPGRPWTLDRNGRAHRLEPSRHGQAGQFVRALPTDWRLAPVVTQLPVKRIDEAWATVQREGGEGLVAVNLDAPMGARRSKLKIKRQHTAEAVVVSRSPGLLAVHYAGQVFTLSARARGDESIGVGDVVEFAHLGWYERTATPKHATLLRRRADLVP